MLKEEKTPTAFKGRILRREVLGIVAHNYGAGSRIAFAVKLIEGPTDHKGKVLSAGFEVHSTSSYDCKAEDVFMLIREGDEITGTLTYNTHGVPMISQFTFDLNQV